MELAIVSKKPAFENPIYVGSPLFEPEVKKNLLRYIDEIFERNYFTNDGPLVREFEKKIAAYHKVDHCVAVCNGTTALLLTLKAMGLEGEVIIPSFTFIATAHACAWQGLKPVFCDIEEETWTLDIKKAEALLTEKTAAVIGVHLFGNVCHIGALTDFCKKNQLALLFDSAHAFGCSFGSEPIGRFGNAEIISFHATKSFTTFEGGAVLTNDKRLSDELRLLRNFGFKGYDNVASMGLNAKMTEIAAAMGLASLPGFEGRIEKNRRVTELYRSCLGNTPGISFIPVGLRGKTNYHYVPLRVDEAKFGISRDLLYRILWEENVHVRRYFYPGCHRMEPYRQSTNSLGQGLSITEKISEEVLCLPCGLTAPEKNVLKIAEIIKQAQSCSGQLLEWERANPCK